jgi:transketolase
MTLLKRTPSEKIQTGISAAMIACRAKGFPVLSVSADLPGSTGVAEFQKAHPEATLDVGVAEANMISAAAGLSIAGYIPVVDTFAQFGVTKGALPLTMANLSLGPVIAVFSHTGFQDAADGASHQALSFFAQVASIPHVEIYSLSTSSEAEALMTQAIEGFAADRKAGKVPPTRIFFLGRENFPKRLVPDNATYTLGKSQLLLDASTVFPKSVTIVAQGSLVPEALKAADLLREKSVGAIVIHGSAVNQPDLPLIKGALARTSNRLVTVEEHRMTGGMGAMLIHAVMVDGGSQGLKAKSLAVGNHFGQSAYSALDLYKKHGLDAKSIAAAALEL